MFRNRLRPLTAIIAVAAALTYLAVEASAAPRFNAGSRGSRTFSAPPPTATTPNAARPIERSATQPGQPRAAAAAPGASAPASGGLFNRPGLLGGLAAGFLGAGLFGLLFGHGLAGGLGSIASFLGLLLQIGIVALVAMFVWRWWQSRSQPALAAAGGSPLQQTAYDPRPKPSFGGGGFGGNPAQMQTQEESIEVTQDDLDTFERQLTEIEAGYSGEDLATLRAHMTPEMLSYFSDELSRNASRGIVDQVVNVKLQQGDVSEAWREGDDEYATVAMRYSFDGRTVDRASGRVTEDGPQENTELWTFRRARGGQWLLSAIQQAD
jgi:predicted lipid-binding transport protein (Tim44 family)